MRAFPAQTLSFSSTRNQFPIVIFVMINNKEQEASAR